MPFNLNRSNNAAKAPDFKLTYFNARGRGELTRLIFAKSGARFDDERIEFDQWADQKASYPMGQLPVLTFKGQQITQSLTIARFAAKKCGLAGKGEIDDALCDQFVTALWTDILEGVCAIYQEKDEEKKKAMADERKESTAEALGKLSNFVKGDFVLGKQMSYADLAILDIEPWLALALPDVECPAKFKEIARKVEADPKIAAYLKARPQSEF